MAYLKVSGTKIVDGNGQEVILRGAGLGGWMKSVVLFLLTLTSSDPLRLS